MRRLALASIAWLVVVVATAAELPKRAPEAKGAGAQSRTCFIGGAPGVETAGGVCIRVSGYVSSQVSAGAVKH